MTHRFPKGNVPWNKGLEGFNARELNPKWKGGKPDCLDCKKQLSTYNSKTGRCKVCFRKALPLNVGTFKKGHKPWHTGTKGILVGEKHPRWIKDRSKLKSYDRDERRSSEYAAWRKVVWLRDNFKCKIDNPDCLGRIEAHHILSWRNYPDLRYQVNNGITLCHFHHPKRRRDEEKLSPYFQKMVTNSVIS